MSADISGHTIGDISPNAAADSKVSTLFPPQPKDKTKAESPPPANSANSQPDPLQQLVGSLQRWDDYFQENFRDVERRLTGVNDRVRRHDEMFPAVNQSLKTIQDVISNRFQSMQGSFNSQNERIDAHTDQLMTLEAGLTQIGKDIAGLRAQLRATKRQRSWGMWLAVLALLGLMASTAIQFGLIDVATALTRIIDFG